jgi:citronellyl-CoA dehydrogenase
VILTEEHEALRTTVRRFIEGEINPHADDWEAAEAFPAHDLFKKMGNLGLLGITKPREYGGSGLDFSFGAIFDEALGGIDCVGVSMAIGVQTEMATPALARFGSEELKREFLAPSISGDLVSCIGVSEHNAGSDVSAIKTTAVRDGDDYVINGTKMWITSGTQADWMCMLANTSDGPVHKNKSLICVPLKQSGKHTKGVTVARKLKKLVAHSSDTAEVHFDDVRVPVRNCIGEEGSGFRYQMMQFQEERLYAALGAIGSCEKSIAQTIEYTQARHVFGRPILDNQVVQFRLAELSTEVEALRALAWSAVDLHVRGGDCTKLTSMAKLKAGRLSREVNDSCLQYFGGMGLIAETPIARRYRDGRLGSIVGGADEIMLGIISKYMGISPPRHTNH